MTTNILSYRENASEKLRTADLLKLIPQGLSSALDIGARDGFYSRLLGEYFSEVTALDLEKPGFVFDRVLTVAGDATRLPFPENSFDFVFCTEVLEHVPELEKACREIARVARQQVLIGVPYKQDLRVARTKCRSCGRRNPPWGHVNRFDEHRLAALFPELTPIAQRFVGSNCEATNVFSAKLMDLAGNPWGTYQQSEPCVYCGAKIFYSGHRSVATTLFAAAAVRIDWMQSLFATRHANWIHMLFAKDSRQLTG